VEEQHPVLAGKDLWAHPKRRQFMPEIFRRISGIFIEIENILNVH